MFEQEEKPEQIGRVGGHEDERADERRIVVVDAHESARYLHRVQAVRVALGEKARLADDQYEKVELD